MTLTNAKDTDTVERSIAMCDVLAELVAMDEAEFVGTSGPNEQWRWD